MVVSIRVTKWDRGRCDRIGRDQWAYKLISDIKCLTFHIWKVNFPCHSPVIWTICKIDTHQLIWFSLMNLVLIVAINPVQIFKWNIYISIILCLTDWTKYRWHQFVDVCWEEGSGQDPSRWHPSGSGMMSACLEVSIYPESGVSASPVTPSTHGRGKKSRYLTFGLWDVVTGEMKITRAWDKLNEILLGR